MIAVGQVFIYLRTSPGEAWTLESQLDACLELCEERGLNVGLPTDEFRRAVAEAKANARFNQRILVVRDARLFKDSPESRSLPLSRRPAGKELLGLLRRGDSLVVADLTRVGGSAKDVGRLLKRLSEWGVALHTPGWPPITDDNKSKFLTAVWNEAVQVGDELHSEATVAGQQRAVAEGRYQRPQPPVELGRTHVVVNGRQCVADHEGEQLLCGFVAWWFWVEGLSHEAIYMRLNLREWQWLKQGARHQRGRGRSNYSLPNIRRMEQTAGRWLGLAAAKMDVSIPPESEWKRDPQTRERRRM